MDEQNPALTSMLNADMKNHTLKVRDEIVRSFEMWTDVGRTMPRLTVRKVRQGIVYQQLFMNEGRMIYAPYNMSTTTYYSATGQALALGGFSSQRPREAGRCPVGGSCCLARPWQVRA